MKYKPGDIVYLRSGLVDKRDAMTVIECREPINDLPVRYSLFVQQAHGMATCELPEFALTTQLEFTAELQGIS